MKIGIASPIQTEPLKEFLDDKNIGNAPGGLGGTPVTQLVKGLLKAGHNVSVYSLDFNVDKPEIFKGERLALYYGAYRLKHRIWNFFKQEIEIIRDFILEDRPDLVHAHWTYEYALGALASKYPTLISVHDWAPAIFWLKRDHYRMGRLLMAISVFYKGSHFLSNSPYIRNYLKKYLRIDAPVSQYGLDESLFFQHKKSLNTECPTIISISNGFGKRKNVNSLISAFRIIKKKVPGCRLLLVGSGFENNGEAYNWTKKNCRTDGINFLGLLAHDEVLKILETADLLIHPALEESFGMIFLEAMAKRTPIIGGKHSGAVPWVLNYGEAGVLADIRSPELIAKEAIRLVMNKKLWASFSEAGYKYARGNFHIEKIVDEIICEYKKLIFRSE
jgi:glycosyltransferase involved in cell wall biosynthesis